MKTKPVLLNSLRVDWIDCAVTFNCPYCHTIISLDSYTDYDCPVCHTTFDLLVTLSVVEVKEDEENQDGQQQ